MLMVFNYQGACVCLCVWVPQVSNPTEELVLKPRLGAPWRPGNPSAPNA